MMQTDVKSYHTPTATPGVAFAGRTRLRGAVVSNTSNTTPTTTMVANNVGLAGTYNVPGTTTCTVTTTLPHGLATGARVFVNFTTGTSTPAAAAITVTSTTAFTLTVASATTSGNVTVYAQILLEADATSNTPYTITIPGEGILANDGLFVGVTTNTACTVFYG